MRDIYLNTDKLLRDTFGNDWMNNNEDLVLERISSYFSSYKLVLILFKVFFPFHKNPNLETSSDFGNGLFVG